MKRCMAIVLTCYDRSTESISPQNKIYVSLKIPSREGKEGFGLQGWVLSVRDNPPLHPSSGRGIFSSFVLLPWQPFSCLGVPRSGMRGSPGKRKQPQRRRGTARPLDAAKRDHGETWPPMDANYPE